MTRFAPVAAESRAVTRFAPVAAESRAVTRFAPLVMRASILLGLAVVAGGCSSSSNTLDGSLSVGYQFPFDHVRARLYTSELAIEYVDSLDAVPVRVSVSQRVNDLHAGGRYDLLETGAVTGQRSNGTMIPRFTAGTITLDEYQPRQGATVEGSFTAQFDTGRDTLGLDGSFSAKLEVVDTPEPPL